MAYAIIHNMNYLILFALITLIPYSYSESITDKSKMEIFDIQDRIQITKDLGITELQAILKHAERNNLPVSIAGCQHSQGGHTFYKNGIVIDLSNWNKIEILNDETIRVQAGATWKQVLETINPSGLSVLIMQSDYDFSIGGTISVNAHGWQANQPPIVNSVKGLHLMLADGSIQYCSLHSNRELFLSVIGGYGLIGIIIDVDLHVIPNFIYNFRSISVNAQDFIKTFYDEVVDNSQAELFFARFNLDSKNFLDKLILGIMEKRSSCVSQEPLQSSNFTHFLDQLIGKLFAKTQTSNFFRKLKWNIENNNYFTSYFDSSSHNQLLYRSVDLYLTKDPNKTDILQEYFIPIDRFLEFTLYLKSLKKELQNSLMNITVRQIKKDELTLLNYAHADVLSFVMFFRIPKKIECDKQLQSIAQKILGKTIALGGSYYLPYRPYPTLDQFKLCYPKASNFLKIKKQYDPLARFQSQFYEQYLKNLSFG